MKITDKFKKFKSDCNKLSEQRQFQAWKHSRSGFRHRYFKLWDKLSGQVKMLVYLRDNDYITEGDFQKVGKRLSKYLDLLGKVEKSDKRLKSS